MISVFYLALFILLITLGVLVVVACLAGFVMDRLHVFAAPPDGWEHGSFSDSDSSAS